MTKIYAEVLEDEALKQFNDAIAIECVVAGALMPDARETELLPWQPKKDEWCWFYDKEFKTAILAKYISMCKTEVYTYFRSSYHIDNGLFLCCEPFIGELPSWIKD